MKDLPEVHPLWQPIEEFDGTEGTYFIISDGSPFEAAYHEGHWWISGIGEPVEPTEFMVIPMYRAWRERLRDFL